MPKINGMDFTIGADPELFVTRKGELVSAHDLIPGTKRDPHKVKKGAVQVDGMALEFNINPVKNEKEWEENITSVLSVLQGMVPDHDFFIEPVAEFGSGLISSVPDYAKELGCDPDFNAYTGEANPRPDAGADFRTASGHVHVGWQKKPVDPFDPGHFEACCALAKMMDHYLAVPSLLWDKDVKRRSLYGKAGSFRPKPYGMEYRVLSNKWIKAFPDDMEIKQSNGVLSGKEASARIRRLIYGNTVDAIKALFQSGGKVNGAAIKRENDSYEDTTVENIINECLTVSALGFLHTKDIKIPRDYAA